MLKHETTSALVVAACIGTLAAVAALGLGQRRANGSGGVAISVSPWHSCAVTTSGAAQCWGYNAVAQLGDGSKVDRHTPVFVSGLSSGVAAVAAGNFHSCALTTGGGVKCWGMNNWGQLGDGTTTDRITPADVVGLTSGVAAISAGLEHTCAVTVVGAVKCWGRNTSNELGVTGVTLSSTPVVVPGLASGAASISAGGAYTCAVTSGGGAKCWGSNTWGQLGNGSGTSDAAPQDVVGLTSGVAAISASTASLSTCAVLSSGGVKCWGANTWGQLGDGTTIQQSVPVDVIGLTGVASISAAGGHTCAVTTAGAATCWGDNYLGDLGDGTGLRRLTPVDVSGLTTGVTAIAAAGSATCAVTGVSGDILCWGSNEFGNLGDGTTLNRSVPVAVVGLLLGTPTPTNTPTATPTSVSQTLVVNSSDDPGPASCTLATCTLRAAMTEANVNPGKDTIGFNIGMGPQTIRAASPLPPLVYPVTFDGSSQPGFGGTPLIALSGENLVPCVDGLHLEGGNSSVEHLAIYGFCGAAIELSQNGSDVVSGNYIGLNIDGASVFRRGTGTGILVTNVSSNVIGGVSPGSGNVISGTAGAVSIYGAGATANVVAGNLIGTDATGMLGLRNGAGISVTDASNNAIGGTSPAARNVIAASQGAGISIMQASATTTANLVMGNFIGTDAAGVNRLPNDQGVSIRSAVGNTIGGTAAGAGNLISGNTRSGVNLEFGASGNLIQGNRIGTTATGETAARNLWGITVNDAPANYIGGMSAGAGNLISGNAAGVVIYSSGIGPGSSGNVLQGNLIGTDPTGMTAVPNTGEGVGISAATANIIGGPDPGARNVISGNGSGILLYMAGATDNQILNNVIGATVDLSAPLPNTGNGIAISSGSSGNAIGGPAATYGNVIAGNGGDGVVIDGTSGFPPLGNSIRHNAIFSNGGKGIETLNGGNLELAPPVVSTVVLRSAVYGTACANCTIEVYADNFDQGRVYEGTTTANGAGAWLFSGTIDGGFFLTTTATDAAGNTSEFSVPVAIDGDGDGYPDLLELLLAKDPSTFCSIMRADVNGSGKVTLGDLILTAQQYNQDVPPATARYNQNGDAKITLADLILMAQVYNQNVSACP